MYSYVVDHDYGISPNPFGGFCTLAFCKFSEDGVRRNVVEMAEVGDWIVGTGGKSKLSAGHGRLVYAMRVTEKLTLRDYFRDARFKNRAGNKENIHLVGSAERFALISETFYYFGNKAPKFASRHRNNPIEKKGPAYRAAFEDDFITDFVAWLEEQFTFGVHGSPCAASDLKSETCELTQLPKKRAQRTQVC